LDVVDFKCAPNFGEAQANRAKSASWNNFPQTIFSFICRHCFTFAAVFRDSRYIFVTDANQPNTLEYVCLLLSPSTGSESNRFKSRQQTG
jgi:hypothetical protein